MLESRIAYACVMIIAACVATKIVARNQQSLGMTRAERLTLIASGFVGASFAAKLPFLLLGSDIGPWWTTWLGDGKTILWALVGGYVGVEAGKAMLDIRIRTGDSFVVGIAVAIAVGRIGCLLFGCCFGTPTELPWGICFATAEDGGMIARHPTQLYESLFHLAFAVIAAYGTSRTWLTGDWMPVYLIAYCVYRFVSEFIRPELRLLAGLTFYQLSAIAIALSMTTVLWQRHRQRTSNPIHSIHRSTGSID